MMAGKPQPPFRLVDRVLESHPPLRCTTLKIFSAGEPLLQGAGAVPSALLLEALCQSAACLPGEGASEDGVIVRIDEAVLAAEVRPGDRLTITTTLVEGGESGLLAESRGEVEGREVARLRVLISRRATRA